MDYLTQGPMVEQKRITVGTILGGSVLEPNPRYRTAIGILGVTLPFTLLLWPGIQGVQTSISAYYYTPARDWFVGNLWVIGVFLFFYQYKPRSQVLPKLNLPIVRSGFADALLGKVAGLAAVVAALVPTAPPGLSTQPPIIGLRHGFAAFVLFLSLSLFPLVLFSQSKKRVSVYKTCGWVMLGLLAFLVAYAVLFPESLRVSLAPWKPVFVAELLLICAFGISWFVKGREIGDGMQETPRPTSAAP